MTSEIRPLIAGNWKMNGTVADLREAQALAQALDGAPAPADVALCPPATLIAQMVWALRGSDIAVGGQDCHAKASGAFTGDVSAEMLADAGARLVIVGHSERRAQYGETDGEIAAKAGAALRAGLRPVVCTGETFEQRQTGRVLEVIGDQLAGSLPDSLADAAFAVAYEPPDQIAEVHGLIRTVLVKRFGAGGAKAPILYGGSVKPDNAAEILHIPDVGGALVGGASLKAEEFLQIIRAL
jgi:triosephosphate isomerase (TIM)